MNFRWTLCSSNSCSIGSIGALKVKGIGCSPIPTPGQIYHASPIQQDYIRAAGRKAELPGTSAGITFRHTYRSLLNVGGAPVGVQQKLMRRAHVSTTMDLYGNAQMESKRMENTKVVQMVLPSRDLQVAV